MIIEPYHKPNWWTAQGIAKKRKEIEAKGIPSLKNWRFFTFTIDPSLFDSPLSAYLHNRGRIRRVSKAIGDYLGVKNPKWCCKFEFQENGWPHWHMGFDYRRKMTEEQMRHIAILWAVGYTDTQRIEGHTLHYFFKYVFKCPDTNQEVPQWFGEYIDHKTGKTFERARFWSCSKNFYTGDNRKAPAEKKPPKTCLYYRLVARVLDYVSDQARVRTWKAGKKISHVVTLEIPYSKAMAYLWREAIWNGIGFDISPEIIETEAKIIEQITETKDKWKIKQAATQQQEKYRQQKPSKSFQVLTAFLDQCCKMPLETSRALS